MLGSVQDAEDMVQETFLRAWRHRETFEGRASIRAWLYRIATNVCLDALDKRPRRAVPVTRQAASAMGDSIPPAVREPVWLEPYPDDLLAVSDDNPEGRYSARESITLAFVAALHLLPPRQRAVLIMRDVLDWQASEVADLLDMTVPAVKSALHRARSTLAAQAARTDLAGRPLDDATQQQLKDYVRAWETADVNTLLTLLKENAAFSMPPLPVWFQGREAIRWLVGATVFSGDASGRWRLLPTRANGQLAFGLYRRDNADSPHKGYGIQVLTFDGGQITDITTFINPALFPYFRLPAMPPR
jgi:RNA polymerase sigma-70 factor (ECF subfamily)